MYNGEHCNECGMPIRFFTRSYWNTNDNLWDRVVGTDKIILCPPCFTELANSKGIHISWVAVEQG